MEGCSSYRNYLPASSNAVDQSKQLENVADRRGDDVSIVQVVTGENVRMDDLDIIADITNATWPILIDDEKVGLHKGCQWVFLIRLW